jgi:membrane protein DedA with SNARE-associated domain
MLEGMVNWLVDTVAWMGYPGIVLLMALESSFFPFPSEVVLPPAGYAAAQGRLNIWLVFGSGLLGSLIGALFNYWFAVRLGRPLLHALGRRGGVFGVLFSEKTLERSEVYFREHGEISTFVARLLPGIRQYISLPAGLARMRMERFILYTALGAGIWCAVLTWIGWYLGTQDVFSSELVHRYARQALLVLLPALIVIVAVYIWWRRRGGRRDATTPPPGGIAP